MNWVLYPLSLLWYKKLMERMIKMLSNPPVNDRASCNACWICGEVGHYANECPHNMSNIKSKGTKKTSMHKKGGECTYTITGIRASVGESNEYHTKQYDERTRRLITIPIPM